MDNKILWKSISREKYIPTLLRIVKSQKLEQTRNRQKDLIEKFKEKLNNPKENNTFKNCLRKSIKKRYLKYLENGIEAIYKDIISNHDNALDYPNIIQSTLNNYELEKNSYEYHFNYAIKNKTNSYDSIQHINAKLKKKTAVSHPIGNLILYGKIQQKIEERSR